MSGARWGIQGLIETLDIYNDLCVELQTLSTVLVSERACCIKNIRINPKINRQNYVFVGPTLVVNLLIVHMSTLL